MPSRVFILVQLLLIAGFGAVAVLGDRSQPRIREVSGQVAVSEPIVITFDRPMVEQDVRERVVLTSLGAPVPVTYRWSSRALAVIPEQPLDYQVTYELSVSGVQDRAGRVMREPQTFTIQTPAPRFLYLTEKQQLARFEVSSAATSLLTRTEEVVLGYEVSSDGTRALLSIREGTSQRFRLELLTLVDGFVADRRTLLTREDASFAQVRVCASGAYGVAYEQAFDGAERILAVALDTGERTVLRDTADRSGTELQCSAVADVVAYLNGEGLAAQTRISEPEELILGRYRYLYEVSRNGLDVVLGDVAGGSLPSPRFVARINEDGIRSVLSDERIDVGDPDVAAARLVAVETLESGLQQVVASETIRGTTYRSILAEGEVLQRPRWSPSNRMVVYERGSSTSDNLDGAGYVRDGELVLARVRFDRPLGQPAIPEPLGVRGGDVRWLP